MVPPLVRFNGAVVKLDAISSRGTACGLPVLDELRSLALEHTEFPVPAELPGCGVCRMRMVDAVWSVISSHVDRTPSFQLAALKVFGDILASHKVHEDVVVSALHREPVVLVPVPAALLAHVSLSAKTVKERAAVTASPIRLFPGRLPKERYADAPVFGIDAMPKPLDSVDPDDVFEAALARAHGQHRCKGREVRAELDELYDLVPDHSTVYGATVTDSYGGKGGVAVDLASGTLLRPGILARISCGGALAVMSSAQSPEVREQAISLLSLVPEPDQHCSPASSAAVAMAVGSLSDAVWTVRVAGASVLAKLADLVPAEIVKAHTAVLTSLLERSPSVFYRAVEAAVALSSHSESFAHRAFKVLVEQASLHCVIGSPASSMHTLAAHRGLVLICTSGHISLEDLLAFIPATLYDQLFRYAEPMHQRTKERARNTRFGKFDDRENEIKKEACSLRALSSEYSRLFMRTSVHRTLEACRALLKGEENRDLILALPPDSGVGGAAVLHERAFHRGYDLTVVPCTEIDGDDFSFLLSDGSTLSAVCIRRPGLPLCIVAQCEKVAGTVVLQKGDECVSPPLEICEREELLTRAAAEFMM